MKSNKIIDPRASQFILYLKKQGLSYQWIEHRMGRSENWAKRVALDGAYVTQDEVDLLETIVSVIKLLPRRRCQKFRHRAREYIKNVNPIRRSEEQFRERVALLIRDYPHVLRAETE